MQGHFWIKNYYIQFLHNFIQASEHYFLLERNPSRKTWFDLFTLATQNMQKQIKIYICSYTAISFSIRKIIQAKKSKYIEFVCIYTY